MVRVPVWTPQRAGPSLERIRRLFGPIRESRTYLRILYLLLALPLGVIEFSFLVTALSFGFGTAITLIGIPVLVATVWAWRWMAHVERRIIGRLLGTEIPEPYRPDPPDTRWWKRLGARLADPATWKDLAFLLLQLPLGIVSFSIAVSVIGFGLRLLLAPAFTVSESMMRTRGGRTPAAMAISSTTFRSCRSSRTATSGSSTCTPTSSSASPTSG